MKILVLSDSHGALRFMRNAISRLMPDAVVHLGDHYDDVQTIAEEYPHLIFHCVPGNCDQFRVSPDVARTLCYCVGGVRLYMTHGHLHGVKSSLYRLVSEGRKAGAKGILFGHTHQTHCEYEDGVWILNPGSCGHSGGSVGMIEIKDGNITDCRVFPLTDLEDVI